MVVAIDGPAGAGKSTLGRRLAETLGLPFVNTGLMYRSVAERALRQGVGPDDGRALASIARSIRFALSDGPLPELRIDGREPDQALTSEEVETTVSRVSRHPEVRAVLREEQQRLGANGGVVEGRDIGTVVFPDAHVKLFLAAPEAVRAGRREQERGGGTESGAAALARDSVDARTIPLVATPGAHVIETTSLSRDQVFDEALAVIRAALQGRGG